ncbi:MAG: altronate dehydratase [Betaproteobacteria bacterium AqS2]|uniref:Altronate dehydratase n=1 Tax=Candidatus Amphirhobacter heronislandensis TaxID=1732024 RepID=A0A930UD10_9GAMM|nr:altronate dehydratase [Betaproteobacteria bacterium AqS2]
MLDARDNVAIAARTLRQGERLGEVVVRGDVPKGHKIAVAPIARGALVRKYAQMIGHAKRAIKAGEHVHVHNLAFRQSRPDYRIGKDARRTKMTPAKKRATFMGYRRPGGRVGTRNYVAVISSVNCSATASRMIAGRFSRARLARQHPNVDGVVAFVHGSGCGMAPDGEGIANLRRVMRGYAAHPNVAAVLLVGLGCEDNQLGEFLATQGLRPGRTLRMLTIQGAGGLRRAVASGVAAVEELLAEADKCKRSACSAADLRVALQCGGSDAWSGVTANPALGHAVDLLVAQGGSAVIAETPEVYGAEHLLTCRAESPAVARALIARLRWWEDYTARNGGSMDNNPSPGNKLGGLTTILEKSLGAVAKGGTTAFREFVPYASPPRRRGFVMMDSPGYDPVSVTGQIAAGCNLVAFTTGRGSAFGSKPAPTLKICTNSETYRRMREDMDVDAGAVVAAGRPLPQVGEEIFARLLALASGERSKSERQGLGDLEFVPWQIGATM